MAPLVLLSSFAQRIRPLVTEMIHRAAGSCSGPRLDPPCECTAPPTPPCRTVSSPPASTVRIICRPPAPAPSPPCPPCEPRAPLTCGNYSAGKHVSLQTKSSLINNLEKGRDRVACRLGRAERARRLSYEQEAAHNQRSPTQCTPAVRYQFMNDSVEGNCHIRRGAHFDPCAHRPRIQLDIQRTTSEPLDASSSRSNPQLRDDNAAHRGRCERAVAPATGHSSCRPISIVEWLKSRSCTAEGSRRGLHSLAGSIFPDHKDRLVIALQNRERLREAGYDRVTCGARESESVGNRAAGILENGR